MTEIAINKSTKHTESATSSTRVWAADNGDVSNEQHPEEHHLEHIIFILEGA